MMFVPRLKPVVHVTAMALGPLPELSTMFGMGRPKAALKHKAAGEPDAPVGSEPLGQVNPVPPAMAGALPFGLICTRKESAETVTPPFRVSATGTLTVVPGPPVTLAAERVPSA